MSNSSPIKRNLGDISYESPGSKSTNRKAIAMKAIRRTPTQEVSFASDISDNRAKSVSLSILAEKEFELNSLLDEIKRKEEERKKIREN